jgi:hypothetical protein
MSAFKTYATGSWDAVGFPGQLWGPLDQGYFFWLQNTEGEPVVGVFATNHQPQVLPPYFAARKNNPAPDGGALIQCKLEEGAVRTNPAPTAHPLQWAQCRLSS